MKLFDASGDYIGFIDTKDLLDTLKSINATLKGIEQELEYAEIKKAVSHALNARECNTERT